MSDFTIELGSEVKSKINGFKGIATARAEHIHGCNRYWVEPPLDKEGKLVDGRWFDEGELQVIEKPKIERKNNNRGGFSSPIK